MHTKLILFFTIIVYLGSCNTKRDNANKDGTITDDKAVTLFDKIDAAESNITFANNIKPDLNKGESLFDYDYFYNGAGVGIEDLNNDGLLDIFFCGNQVANSLYLNKGDFKFVDVSSNSNISKINGWSNGVTFVDINNDGWQDIYISQGGPYERNLRKNVLYINQKNGTFIDQAESYGLADTGISTQSVFFDMDKDGDLDCLVMNENEFYGVNPIELNSLLKENPESLYYNSSHLYRNDNGKFKDITKLAGIEKPLFGLGLAITDINNDGWLDIYFSSDYYIPDALFINNKNGTFTDKIKNYTQQISFFGMGVDIADINNDNLQDIFVLDMSSADHIRSKTLMASMNTQRFNYYINEAKYHHQYMYNSLQLNLGNNKFNNISQMSGIANTDWSWSVLLSDFDLDGKKDIHISNGYRKYGLDKDLQTRVYETQKKYKGNVPLSVKTNLYESMPSEKLPNIMYKQESNLSYTNVAKDWGLTDYSFSNGVGIGDLDNDGDLDMIVNNMDEKAFLYKNNAVENKTGNFLKVQTDGVLSESFAKITIYYNGKSQTIENRRVRGYRSAQQNVAFFGLGNIDKIDTVKVVWGSGKKEQRYNITANSNIIFKERLANISDNSTIKESTLFKNISPNSLNLSFNHQENVYDDFEKEILLPYKQSTLGPYTAKGDINNDGLEDLYIGGASGQAGQIYLQQKTGFKKLNSTTLNNDSSYEDMESVFFDFDGDNDLDLFVVSGGNEFEEYSSYYADRLYINDGKANFIKHESDILKKYPKSGKSVTIIDYDKDGDKDIIVGNRIIPKNYPKYAASTVYENVNGTLKDVTKNIAPDLLDYGIINSLVTTDYNNDGWLDFIAVGEWAGIGFFKNNRGTFSYEKNTSDLLNEKGWWYSVNETDINNDGLKDYIVGNIGLNIKVKANSKNPFKINATDFDGNGTHDIVLSKQYNGEYVPVRGRQCSSEQMPFIKEKFKTYTDFAHASLDDIYGEKLNTSYAKEATNFSSLLLVNQGDGKFTKTVLPIEAQSFPLLKTVFHDLNNDGFKDAILAGNIYNTEVETPRLDAISGIVLISNQKDGYNFLPYTESGLYLDGNIKSIEKIILSDDTPILISTRNNGPLEVHSINQ